MYRHKRPLLTFLRLDRSIIFGSYLFFYRRTSDLLSCYCCLDHQKTRYKKYHSFYASFFALSLWLCLLFGLCACLYVCAVQISNVCIHYNIILFFRLFSHYIFALSMMRSVLVYRFFLFILFAYIWMCRVNSNGFQQTLTQMHKYGYFCGVHCLMCRKTHSKPQRI